MTFGLSLINYVRPTNNGLERHLHHNILWQLLAILCRCDSGSSSCSHHWRQNSDVSDIHSRH